MKGFVEEKKSLHGIDLEKVNQIWDDISAAIAKAFSMTEDETGRFKAKNIAKLIGTLPFIAGCEDAQRTAVVHLGAYILSVKETKHYFNAGPSDNKGLFERLRLCSSFKGGDRRIIEKGMGLLALCMIEDYERDIHLDTVLGKYNPVSDGVFDYPALRQELLKKIESVECLPIDSIMNSDVEPLGFWGW